MKTLKIALMCIFAVAMITSIASADKDPIQVSMDMLKSSVESTTYSAVGSDEAGSYASSSSEEDSVSVITISGVSTIGDNTLAGAFSQGEGDDVSLSSFVYLEGDTVSGEGESYIEGDEVDAGSSASTENGDDYNSISIETFANGIGDASGYTWVFGWE